jgi:hypothetical protein
MYWFCIGMMMSAPAFNAWLPCSQDSRVDELELIRVLELRQEVGEPMRPRPDPPK